MGVTDQDVAAGRWPAVENDAVSEDGRPPGMRRFHATARWAHEGNRQKPVAISTWCQLSV